MLRMLKSVARRRGSVILRLLRRRVGLSSNVSEAPVAVTTSGSDIEVSDLRSSRGSSTRVSEVGESALQVSRTRGAALT